ncbi:D-alanyl-D-alanine carboxypeptidase DacF [Pontiella desulfatans]|uniref:D-alanyl-D-alanine carboxypeptidase DacF n=1 Tax=Pontiella desulfatans TaxID=2750659 RepID=A0A6C2U7V9_PONDE|nr:D-alanyl-D-alanine carboxypeptidase family protein [Pontiella desulfatans]VGO16140.1 D-alanyl-D-alanine carboxypeptidase DacF [Pontiella desulfatans]
MKKSNVTFIAAVLISLHVLAFMLFLGSKEGKADKQSPPTNPAAPSAPAPEPAPSAGFEMPELQVAVPELAEQKLEIVPVEVVEMPKAAPREAIAHPRNIKGYLRSDRSNRRTSKTYSSLVGNPYQGAIVIDARTGKILHEDRAAVYAYPASVTKMMTMLIVLEQIDKGLVRLSDRVKITPEIAGIGGSGVYLDVRESGAFTVEQMLQALMIHSANDAAAALAFHVAGSIDGFVDMMNQKARELGMNSTTYHTPHGLPITAQPDISTAYDIAILSLAALRHPQTLEYTGTKLAWLPTNSLRKEKFMLANRNALVGKEPYPGCDGLKTGYHSKGGYSLAATAKQGNHRVVSVILGVPDRDTRNATTRKLLDKGFQKLKQN